MLQLIRDRAQGWLVGVIVFLICLTFALFGAQQYLDARSTVVVAEVNGEKVSRDEFQRAFQQLRQRVQAIFGDNFEPERWSGEQAKLMALDYVVDEHLLLQVIDDANIRASDAQIANYVRSSPQFQRDGLFSKDLYKQMVRAVGLTELGFEQQVRKDLVVNQLRAGIGATAFTTAEELQVMEQYRQQSRDVGYAVLRVDPFREGIVPVSEEIEKFFEEHNEDYRIEEKISVSYLELSIETLMSDIPTDEARLRDYYTANQNNYMAQEQRNANHILIQIPRDAVDAEEDTARDKAAALREQALGGTSFEDIARENSDDIGSRTDGGETGFFARGVMAPEFEEAVFSMSAGEISQPIRTEFGFHIIRLKEIKSGGLKSFDEVRDDVGTTYRREQAEALFFEQVEQLSELVYEQPDTLDSAADALGLTVKTTAMLTRSELARTFSASVVEAAFDAEVLLEELNSEPIDVNNGRVVVVRVSKHEPSRAPPLEDVIVEVTQNLIDARAREAVYAHGKAIVKRLNNGEDRQTVIKSEDLKWEDVVGARRDSPKLNRAIGRAAFRSEPPEGEHANYTGVPIGTDDFGIVGISNVAILPIEQLDISDIGQLRRDITAYRTAASWQDFLALLKSDSKIESYPDRL